jgi:glycosyltransferase involved in cell wall biosynthesis
MEDREPRKILIVTHGFPPTERGGTEIYSYSLARALSEKGIEVIIFTRMTEPLAGKDNGAEGYVRRDSEGLRVYKAIDSSNNMREFLNPYVARAFRDIVEKEKPDLIHFQHLVFLSAELPEMAAAYGIPCVMTFHDYWFLCPKVQLLDKENRICEGPFDGANCAFCFDPPLVNEYRLLNRFKKFVPGRFKAHIKKVKEEVDRVRLSNSLKAVEFNFRLNFLKRQFRFLKHKISPSHYLIARFEKEGFEGIQYLPLGFPPVPKVEVKTREKLRLGYMGNINYPKGLALVVKELVPLLQQNAVSLFVYGKPYDLDYFDEIRAKTANLQADAVRFCGAYKNSFEELWKVFSTFDVLVFPSVWEENSPIVLREALLSGKPVIASNLGGVPEIVEDGINGLLFDPFKEGDLLEKTKRILGDRDLLKHLIEGAQKVKLDSLEEHFEKVSDIYKKITE